MKSKTILLTIAAALVSAGISYGQSQANAAAIDSTLFATYTISTDQTSASFSVCGSTQNSEGCFGGGSLGPFGKIGAMLEGNPTTNLSTNTVTRDIFVVDLESGTNKTGVTLYVYTRQDVITPDFDTVTVSLSRTVSLPLTGGATAAASMAANAKNLFIGTNQTPQAVKVDKRRFAATLIGGFSPPINVTSITADQYGYVAVTFGSSTGESGFYLYGPSGDLFEDGGGYDFTLNTIQALLPSTLH